MTRHELKEQLQHDEFTDAVSRVVRYTNEHRERVVRIGIIAAAVLAVAGGLYWYLSYRNSVRDRDLQAVFNVLDAPVGQPNAFVKTFATQAS
ncbi:MAG: hypothetical protein JO270_01645, partial [Acidobacteriaceae bacterium]|nr:hypothetical protein [Acidobacteriaceae bacterium]